MPAKNSPLEGWRGATGWQMSKNITQNLPYNPVLKHRAAELRKAGNLSEVLLWLQIKNKKFKALDLTGKKLSEITL